MADTTPTILYVGSAHDGASPVLDSLRARGAALHTADHVYLALARWGRGVIRPAAVIVCADSLGPSEFEFFRLAARYHGRIPVYVCARTQAASKLEQALQAGARGVLTREDVDEFLFDFSPRADEFNVGAVDSPPPIVSGVLESHPAPDAAVSPDDVGNPGIEFASALAEDSEPPIARVPWKRYDDRPMRRPPARAGLGPPENEPSQAEPSNGRSSSGESGEGALDGPLLTPDELEALMLEDFRTRPTLDPFEGGPKP